MDLMKRLMSVVLFLPVDDFHKKTITHQSLCNDYDYHITVEPPRRIDHISYIYCFRFCNTVYAVLRCAPDFNLFYNITTNRVRLWQLLIADSSQRGQLLTAQ